MFQIFFRLSTNKCPIWNFSEKFSNLIHQKLWLFLYEKLGWKTDKKPLFLRFWDKEAITKIFRKSIFSSALDTPFKPKMFSKCFFFAEIKGLKNEILLFAKVFIFFFINFFHCDFQIFRLRNNWPNRKCLTCHSFVGYIRQKFIFST